ncbi:MAG: hypothetical protein PUG56_02880 [Ruminococcus sp.]|nr:hypothetical protein [Ruminococcus sp.]
MANDNDIKKGVGIPEQPQSPEAIPVDDKGQPLPDPSETLSGYIVPSEFDSLKKSFAQAEEDEDIKDTMEPPQRTNFFRKHKPGSRGYDYYGTPAGSIPNDSNGLEPSPLTKLFSEAEPFEFVPDEDEELPPELPEEPIFESKPIETPKQTSKDINSVSDARELFAQAGYRVVDDDPVFTKKEIKRDENAPRLRDLYKTNTKVIFEAGQNGENIAEKVSTASSISESTAELFKENAKISRTKKRLQKKQERKALRAQIKLEKKKARLQKKADKAAQKAKLKAEKQKVKNKAVGAVDTAVGTQDILGNAKQKRDETAAEKAKLQKQEALAAAKKAKEEKERAQKEAADAAQKAKEEKERAQKEAADAAQKAKEDAQRAIDEANRQKEEAQRAAKLAAKQAAEKLLEERERNRRQAQDAESERVKSEQQALEAKQKLEEEKAKAQKAAEEAKKALEEAEKIKAELSAMKEAAAAALMQKQEAEEAAKKAREEKAKLDEEAKKRELEEKQRQEELAAKRAARLKREEARKAETEKIRMERDEAIAKAHAEKEAAIAKAKAERDAALAKAKAEKEAAIAKAKQASSSAAAKKTSKSRDVYSNSKTADEIKRKIAEMESKLSSPPKDIYISEIKRPAQKEKALPPEFSISKENIISRSAKKDDSSDESSEI